MKVKHGILNGGEAISADFGINKEIATAVSLILHIQELLFVAILAGVSLIKYD